MPTPTEWFDIGKFMASASQQIEVKAKGVHGIPSCNGMRFCFPLDRSGPGSTNTISPALYSFRDEPCPYVSAIMFTQLVIRGGIGSIVEETQGQYTCP